MKRFVKKAVWFLVIGFVVLNLVGYWIMGTKRFTTWHHVSAAVKKSKEIHKIDPRVIILGDSVANQLFSSRRHPLSMTTNGSVMAVGHYILAHHAAQRCKNLKYVVLMSVPHVIGRRFEEKRTYNNFMKPFYNFEHLPLISELLIEKINKKPQAHLALLPFVKTAPLFSDINFKVIGKSVPPQLLSDIALEYLPRLYHLCKANGIELILRSPPVKKSLLKNAHEWRRLKNQIRKENLGHIFEGYFESIVYLEESEFRDVVHLTDKYIKKNRRRLVNHILPERVKRAMKRAQIRP